MSRNYYRTSLIFHFCLKLLLLLTGYFSKVEARRFHFHFTHYLTECTLNSKFFTAVQVISTWFISCRDDILKNILWPLVNEFHKETISGHLLKDIKLGSSSYFQQQRRNPTASKWETESQVRFFWVKNNHSWGLEDIP